MSNFVASTYIFYFKYNIKHITSKSTINTYNNTYEKRSTNF